MIFFCAKCLTNPEKVESSSLALGNPNGPHGIKLYRVSCHGEHIDLAASWRWERDHGDYSPYSVELRLWDGQPIPDLGLRDLVERDGFALPKEVEEKYLSDGLSQGGDANAKGGLRPSTAIEAAPTFDPKGAAQSAPSFFNERFHSLISRALADRQHVRDWKPAVHQAASAIKQSAGLLARLIETSRTEIVPTARVTDAAVDLAIVAMKVFEKFGTPEFRPKENIADALPSKSWEDKSTEKLFAPSWATEPKPLPSTEPTTE